jgi:cyclophilin family peptidyl-prolyl cis-trans isomerase
MDDTTEITISKATRGESLIEQLRSDILSIRTHAQHQNSTRVFNSQKRALRSLSEVGELLVEKFPYDVPEDGKFSYLPRLLGRSKVTFSIVRPAKRNSKDKDQILGNVTVLADGYAAPITAGNFVDLAVRNFYTGLTVKDFKKRLGVTASLTMAEDSVVAYDIASTVNRITGEDGVIKKSFGNFLKRVDEGLGISTTEESEDGSSNSSSNSNANTVLTSMPIMGSFNEGFYDPLTAKPRRIPLEIVQFDRLFGTARLSYESGFSSNTASANATLLSVLQPDARNPPLLTFDIPGLVAMNHPDLNLNGGSSEFFCLTDKNMMPGRTKLLNGKYAPFGYVLEGLDLMKDLQAGDIIAATYVNESGMMNLKKIRGTTFANAMNSEENDR